MGDQRREDTAKAKKDPPGDHIGKEADRENEDGFDTSHAKKQMASRPKARGELHPDAPEHAFEGVGDQDQLWRDFDTLLGTRTVSDRALQMVRDMNGGNRARAGARISEVASVTTGGDLLVIAELTSILPGAAVDAALACATKPTTAQMRAFLMRIGDAELKNQIGDAATVARLRAVYPGSAVAVLPRLPDLLDNEALASWYVQDTPSEQIAMAMVQLDSMEAIQTSKKLDKLGRAGWLWGFHVTDAITSINADAIAAFAKNSSQPDVAEFLQHRVDVNGNSIPKMDEAGKDLKRELGKAKPDADQVVDDLGITVSLGSNDLKKPGNKARFLAVASTRQIDQATQLAELAPSERLDWLLEGSKVTVEELRDVLAAWPDSKLAFGISAKHVSIIRKRWKAASPAEVFGRVPADLYGRLGDSTETRTWIVQRGEPNEILEWLAFKPGATAARCTWLATHGGWTWLDRIGGGIDDHALRIVALHCPDKTITDKIQKQILGDSIDQESMQQKGEAVSPRATEDPNEKFNRESRWKKNKELSDLTGELRAEDIAEIKRDPAAMQKTLANTKGRSLARVLYLLDPPLIMLLQRTTEVDHDEGEVAIISGWVRTRPAADVVTAFSDATALSRARKLWPSAPLEIFPQLRKAEVLAPVLDANSEVLAWIMENSEPMSMLHAIAASGVVKTTVTALEDQASLVEYLPSGQRLSPRERTYLYGLANNADGSLKKKLMQRIESKDSDDDSSVTDRAVGETRKSLEKSGFAGALKMLVEDKTSPVEDIFALCREHEAEAPKLVSQSGEIAAMALQRTGSSPQVLFPAVPYDLLLSDPFITEATFESVPGFVLLREAATNDALARRLAMGLDGNAAANAGDRTYKGPGYLSWLRRLPSGSSMSATEHAGLKKILAHVMNDAGAGELFKARFGSAAGSSYTKQEVTRLWSTLERVPRAHVEQLAVSGFHEFAKGTKPAEGMYDPEGRGILLEEDLVNKKSKNPVYDRTDDASTKMSRDQVKAAFQIDDKQVDQWVNEHRLKREGDVYTVNPQPQPDRFTGTALHEVGHAVDAMLGSNTELVYKMADWHQFGDADFEAWATELGGWDRVSVEDKKQIRDAWTMWSNSSQGAGRPSKDLMSMVGSGHPAADVKKYSGVGVVDFAMDPDNRGHNQAPFIRNGRAFMMTGIYQERYSIPLSTLHASPSDYSLTAPAEWFAECYMTYYLTYDGTPKTSGEKGKLLAPWIKKWFDEHIDKIGHNPKRGSY